MPPPNQRLLLPARSSSFHSGYVSSGALQQKRRSLGGLPYGPFSVIECHEQR